MTPTLLAGSDVRHLLLDMQQMKVFSANPLIIREARGVYLTDVDGKRYIDGVSVFMWSISVTETSTSSRLSASSRNGSVL